MYGWGDGAILHDQILFLDWRAITTTGLGQFIIKQPSVSLSAEAGVGWIGEAVKALRSDIATLRIAQEYARRLSQSAKVWEMIEYLPEVNNYNSYLLNAEIGVEAMMSQNIALRLVRQNKYDSTPTSGLKPNNLGLFSGLKYAFLELP